MRDLESTLRGTFADRYKRELSSSKSSLPRSFSRRDASTHVPEKRMADLPLLAPQLAMTGSSRATSRSLEPRVSPGLLPEGESSRGSGDLGEERKAELAERLESAPTSHEDPKAEDPKACRSRTSP
jgi:hypothetical protein